MNKNSLKEMTKAGGVAPLIYSRRVAFYETDCMGVVHHTNYLRYFEETRVHWLQQRGLIHLHIPHGPLVWAVVESRVLHRLTLQFDDLFEVRMRVKLQGVRTYIDYFLFCDRHKGELVSRGSTVLVPLDKESRPRRPPVEFVKAIEGEPWIEI